MEDLVYIVLIIVWLLVSFLRKKPKKKQPEPAKQQEPTSTEGEVNMEDMLEEFFGTSKDKKKAPEKEEPVYQSREREVQPVYTDRREQTSVPAKKTVDPAFEDFSGQSGVSDDFEFASDGKIQTIDELIQRHKTKEAMEIAKAEEAYGAMLSDDFPEFDLRTAVIFSEILNKKYS